MPTLHRKKPVRRKPSPRASKYQDHKISLREDFNERCGYCSDSDLYYGNEMGYHIDHFAPKSKFKELVNDYTNLVYSCPICNVAKSNKWIGNKREPSHNGLEGFVDPCSDEFDEHLWRDEIGLIKAYTPVGKYMIENLCLFLLRHQMIWMVGELSSTKGKLRKLRELYQPFGKLGEAIIDCIESLDKLIEEITEYINRPLK